MIHITDPSPIRGDIKLLGTGSGTLPATIPITGTEVGTFTIPALNPEDIVIIIYEVQKDTISGDPIHGYTHYSKSISPANSPAYLNETTGTHIWCKSEVFKSLVDDDKINFYNIRSQTPTTVCVAKGNQWGDLTSSRLVYVMLNTCTDTDLYYKWAAYIIGDGVK